MQGKGFAVQSLLNKNRSSSTHVHASVSCYRLLHDSRRQLKNEERLQREASRELRRRLRRRKARAAGLNPSLLPELQQLKESGFARKRGFFATLPAIVSVPSGIGSTARKVVGALRSRVAGDPPSVFVDPNDCEMANQRWLDPETDGGGELKDKRLKTVSSSKPSLA